MIIALNDYVIISPISEDEQTASGLVFQSATSKNSLKKGKVLEECNAGLDDLLEEGTTVYYQQDKAFDLQEGMDTLVAIKRSDLVAFSKS